MRIEDSKEQNNYEKQFYNAYSYNKEIDTLVSETNQEIINILESAKNKLENLLTKFISENNRIIHYDSNIYNWHMQNVKNYQIVISLIDSIKKVNDDANR